MRAWRSAGVWERLPRFPSDAAKAARTAGGGGCGGGGAWFPCTEMGAAYRHDFEGFSSNLIARKRPGAAAPQPLPPWPELKCS